MTQIITGVRHQQSHTGIAGYGSTNTAVMRFVNTVSLGTNITYASDSVNGDKWTINATGIYLITGCLRDNTGGYVSVGRNLSGAQLNTDPAGSLSNTGDLGFLTSVFVTVGNPVAFCWGGLLNATDVMRLACTPGHTFSTTNFIIVQVSE